MWFKKKEVDRAIYRQVQEYGKDSWVLNNLANFTKIDRIQSISREELKRFAMEQIQPQASLYHRINDTKAVNKFLKRHNVPFILALDEILEITPNGAIVEAMKTVSKFNPTPRTKRNKRIVELKDKGWSYTEIAKEMGLSAKSTVYVIYHREKARMLENALNV